MAILRRIVTFLLWALIVILIAGFIINIVERLSLRAHEWHRATTARIQQKI